MQKKKTYVQATRSAVSVGNNVVWSSFPAALACRLDDSPDGQKMHQLLSSWISALPSESTTVSSSSNAAAVLAAAGRAPGASSAGANQGVSIK